MRSRFLWLQTSSVPICRKCSRAFAYRSQHKGENPVTRDYYQLTHEIANHGAVDSQRSGAVFHQIEADLAHGALPCLASPAGKHQERNAFQCLLLKRKAQQHSNVGHQSYSCLPQLILCCFKFTHMEYLYSTEKLFQRLPFPPALCLLHPD